jgi:DNA repair protein RecN (Recombination protein N)
MSRIMLALKTELARLEGIPTLVFDEIDVGIGGRVATSGR